MSQVQALSLALAYTDANQCKGRYAYASQEGDSWIVKVYCGSSYLFTLDNPQEE